MSVKCTENTWSRGVLTGLRSAGMGLAGLIALACSEPQEHRDSNARVGVTQSALLNSVSFDAVGDTYIKSGFTNHNVGADTVLSLRNLGNHRSLLFFDAAAIEAAAAEGTLVSARIELNIFETSNNWGTGRPIALHRLKQASSEYAATWNCAEDANINNQQANCSGATAWQMAASNPALQPWTSPATDTEVITNGQTGVVSFDVSGDVAALIAGDWAGYGWLLKKENEAQSGSIEFASRERTPAPRLVLEIDEEEPSDAGTPDPVTGSATLTASADTHVKRWHANQNLGTEPLLQIQASGRNRALVNFDTAALSTAVEGGLATAWLDLPIATTYDNWGPDRALNAHRMKQAWSELGATWNCALDTNPGNSSADCSGETEWTMLGATEEQPWVSTPSDTVLVASGQSGVLRFDVTRDVACVLAGFTPMHGWLIRKGLESQSGKIELASQESPTPPALFVEWTDGPGLVVTAEDCAAEGPPGECVPTSLIDASCDGTDDDCDEAIDDDFSLFCTGTGTVSCVEGVEITTNCDDNNACNGSESCFEGACEPGTPPSLDDGNPCTSSTCDPEVGVIHEPLVAGTSCVDANVCNGAETCDGAGICEVGAPLQVDDENPCTADACDPMSGVTHEPLVSGTNCADADVCNGDEACDGAGFCEDGTSLIVDDENPCTTDTCDAVFGVLNEPTPSGASCADANQCDGAETCNGSGACDAGVPLTVDDENPCTGDSCDPLLGVINEPLADGTSCADGNSCNGAESCDGAGTCEAGTPVIIDDENVCTNDACDPSSGDVTHNPASEGTACSIGPCTAGVCDGVGACAPSGVPVGIDGNPCTLDRCDPVLGPVYVECGPVDSTVATTAHEATAWLYSGDNPVQTGVAPGTITVQRAALVTGAVMTREGLPLPDVNVSIYGHAELGETTTHVDGTFDLVVNGGGPLQVQFSKSGFLKTSRRINVAWNGSEVVSDVVLIPPDPVVTPVDLDTGGTDYQVIQGSIVSDGDGTRQATVLFPPGVEAVMRLSDGSLEPISQMNVRVTEFTVGETGGNAMPATLPHNTAYTYAFEINADEAVAAGAPEIEFSEPLAFYVDNFLGFPAGTVVPLGSYDREAGQWVPQQNGIVLDIVGMNGAEAAIDITGDGVAESAATLNSAGIVALERERLANLYSVGASLWRVQLPHFTEPYDCNWPFGPPEDAEYPEDAPTPNQPEDEPCEVSNASTLECQNQIFREAIPVGGSPLSLHYSSARARGYLGPYTIEIPVTGAEIPESLKRVEVGVIIAGRLISSVHLPLINQSRTFIWDGLDKYGRVLQGRQEATVLVSYVYDGVYDESAGAFGSPGSSTAILGSRTRQEIYFNRSWTVQVGAWQSVDAGLGGWSVNVNHAFDPVTQQLLRGDGTVQDATAKSAVVQNVAGGAGSSSALGDGGDARTATLSNPSSIAVGPDGATYVGTGSRLRRISPSGIITTIAGTGTLGFSGDGGPATAAQIRLTGGLAVASDGSVYLADRGNERVRRIAPNGIITTIAGTGTAGFSGDDGPSQLAQLRFPSDVAIAPDGSIYIADTSNNRVRRIANGIIDTVAGNGLAEPASLSTTLIIPDNTPALSARLRPIALDFGPEGTLHILHDNNLSGGVGDRLFTLSTDGILRRIAGCRVLGCTEAAVDIPATQQKLNANDVTVSPQGNPFLIADVNPTGSVTWQIINIGNDGFIRHAFGGETDFRPGEVAAQVEMGPVALTFGPEGLTYAESNALSGVNRNRVTRVVAALPSVGTSETIIPSEGGGELYVFASSGRHLRTLDALTLAPLYTFSYDASGFLSSFEDEVGNLTLIERDSNGVPEAIVDPYGRSTTLETNVDGYLEAVTNAEGETYSLAYTTDGLLETFVNPRGGVSSMTYDPEGRITVDEDAAEAPMSLVRTEHIAGFTVARTTALGRTTSYDVERQSNGVQLRTNTLPDGTASVQERKSNGSTTNLLPDGTEVTVSRSADPRWGATAPVISTRTQLPSGLERVANGSRTAVQTNPLDPSTLTSLVDTNVVNGRTYRTTYTASTRLFTTTSPANRSVRNTTDTLGRVTRTEVTGLTPVDFTYDTDGRLLTVTQGSRTVVASYVPAGPSEGYLASLTDTLGDITSFTSDAVGRPLSTTRAGETTGFAWDALGNLEGITPPGQPEHAMTFTPVNLLESYNPPDAGLPNASTSYAYDLDRMPTSETRPSGDVINAGYDSAGRLDSVSFPGGLVGYDYLPPSAPSGAGQVSNAIGPYGVDLGFSYDGFLPTSVNWSGDVTGGVTWQYNNNFDKVVETVAGPLGSMSTAFGYDNDQLLTCASATTCSPAGADALRLIRSAQHGMVTSITLGSTTENWTYNAFGELARQTSSFGASPLVDITYDTTGAQRDALGRVAQKTEVIAGITKVFGYEYDDLGRLTEVTLGGALQESFTYDGNGNRLSAFHAGSGSVTGTYDEQDRLLSYGDWDFTYTASGELLTKTNTVTDETWSFTYDALGNLLEVTLPDGTLVEYLVDAVGRRVGKKVNGTVVKQWLYRDALKPVAELDGAGNLVSQFVYGSKSIVPDYVIRGGATYRVFSDQLGSPRYVVNVANSADVPFAANYSAFGEITGTGLGWMPFGFAGGIYDTDTGLVRFGARDYDAMTGRWTSKDPILFGGDGPNLYIYVLSDPVNFVDPSGLVITAPRSEFLGWLDSQADCWFSIAGENWLAGDELAAVGPAALGAFVRAVPWAIDIAVAFGGVASASGPGTLKARPDVALSGGRSGGLVKNLTGPPSSATKGGPGRVYVTNEEGQVILDITKLRVKPVTPGHGFGPKRAPTNEELDLLESILGGGG